MATIKTTGLMGKAAGGCALLVGAAWAARQAYELLLPVVPSALVVLGLLALLALLVRLRRR